MAIFRETIEVNGNEIKDFVVDNQASDPGTGVAGRLIYVTADNRMKYWNGTAWITITTSESGEYQLVSEKDQDGGYVGISDDGKMNVSFIPTGVASDQIPLLKGAIANGQGLKYDSTVGGFVAFDISTLYTFQGTCTSAQLDSEHTADAQNGYVYNVSDNRTFNGTTYQGGTNWAWDSTDEQWEPLTGIINLSGYQTIANMVTDVGADASTGIDNSHYPSAQAVKYAIDAVRVIASAAVVANSPIAAGTHTKITYDAKGLVTGGADLTATDIPDLSATYILASRLGTDVAQLVSGTVPIAQLPTGNGENLIPLLPGAGSAGQALVVNGTADGFTFRTVPSHSITSVTETWTNADGATKTIPISFEGNRPAAVTVYDNSGNVVFCDVQASTSQVVLSMNPAPSAGETFNVVIIG